LASNEQLERLNEKLDNIDVSQVKDKLKVGLHTDVQLTSTDWGLNPI
jgi:hypothetical protein